MKNYENSWDVLTLEEQSELFLDWAYMLHRALRKCCDSDASSMFYNAVRVMDDAWKHYLTIVRLNINQSDVAGSLRGAAERMHWGDSDVNLLKLIMGYMDDRDWEGMAHYLEEYFQEKEESNPEKPRA